MLGRILLMVGLLAKTASTSGCNTEPETAGGIKKADVAVPTQTNGLTVEQQNVRDRLLMDNKPGAIKHLYVISAFSGDVLLYSTVRGKVTSSSKRLEPAQVSGSNCLVVRIHGADFCTSEMLEDDGTYGSSIEYLYWWDAKGVYHQHYVSGGQIVHISDQPLRVAKVLINLSPADAH